MERLITVTDTLVEHGELAFGFGLAPGWESLRLLALFAFINIGLTGLAVSIIRDTVNGGIGKFSTGWNSPYRFSSR